MCCCALLCVVGVCLLFVVCRCVLIVVVRCALLAICSSLCAVRCLLCVVRGCCLLTVVCCRRWCLLVVFGAVCCLLCAGRCLSVVVCWLVSFVAVTCWWLFDGWLLLVVWYVAVFAVGCLLCVAVGCC